MTRIATRGLPWLGVLLVGGCGGTTIRSDLVLQPTSRARLELGQPTETIELSNDSDALVRIRVLDRKERVLTNLVLAAHDQAQLDLEPAYAVQFENDSDREAVIRWTLHNDDRIEYSMALNPTD